MLNIEQKALTSSERKRVLVEGEEQEKLNTGSEGVECSDKEDKRNERKVENK